MRRFGPGSGYDPDQDQWELYNLEEDFSQAHDIAAEHPEKLAELKQLFWEEAGRNRALPLLGGFAVFFGMTPPMPTATRFPFAGDVQNIQTSMIPRIIGRSYAIEAEVNVPESGAEGVLVAFADFIGGFALWVDEQGLLNHTYQYLGVETYKQTSTEPIPTGDITLKMLFVADETRPGTGGDVTLWADDRQIGEGRLDRTISLIFTTYAGMDMGRDNGGVVDLAYEDKAPYAFTGTLKEIVFDLHPAGMEDLHALHEHATVQAVGAGAAG
jgi:arylsulfatase